MNNAARIDDGREIDEAELAAVVVADPLVLAEDPLADSLEPSG